MKKLNNKGNVIGVLLLILVVCAVVCFILFKDKLGFGKGDGKDGSGDESEKSSISTENTTEATTEQEGSASNTVVIVVKQSKYFIDDTEYTLTDIEGLIKDDTDRQAKYIMEDKYAGTEAWDQLKSLFNSYDITPIKED